jgi:hypothetical protein
MKKILVLVMALFCFSAAFAVSGAIINSGETAKNITYLTTANAYKDAAPNDDLGLALCDVGPKWVGAAFALNNSGTWIYNVVNQRAGSTTYSLINTSNTATICSGYYTPIDSFLFSSSSIASVPPAFVAAFPGRIYILYSDYQDGTLPEFVLVNFANGSMRGSYSVSSTFDQATKNVSLNVNSISFETDIGTVSKAPSDGTYGLSNDRRLVVGVCTDDSGENCSDGKILNSGGQLPVTLSTGLASVDDQSVYTRYSVVNGLGYSFLIGANLQASVNASNPNPYDGDVINLGVTIYNTGNVNVSSTFNVTLYDNDVPFNTTEITQDVVPGNNLYFTVPYNTYGKSGSHTIVASSDSSDKIVETSEADNNGSTVVNVQTTYHAIVYVDGIQTYTFDEAGRPYTVTVSVINSSGSPTENATVRITEVNGLNMFAQMQLWNDTYFANNKTGLKSYSIAEIVTNSTGNVSFTLVPTGNKLYVSPYSDTYNASSYVGNYSLYLEIYLNGQRQKINGSYQDMIPLYLTNLTPVTTGLTNVNNQGFVEIVTNFVADIFEAVRGWLI